MKILTFLKQVPRLDQVRFDRANRIVRDGVSTMCNPLDALALGHALALREENDEVVVVTMGPPDARELLEDAIVRGADRGIHLTDRLFKGADTLATARALAVVVEREVPDLVLFGRATLDGATAQLGQQVATLAGLPHLSEAVGLRRDGATVTVDRETERRHETWETAAPVVVTVLRGPQPPDGRAGAHGPIEELAAADLGGRPVDYGTRGSPTFVMAVRSPERPPAEVLTAPDDAVRRLRDVIAEARREAAGWEPQAAPTRDLWVYAPRAEDGFERSAYEGLACARSIAAALGARVTAVVLAADVPPADELFSRGADRVLVLRHPDLAAPSPRAAEDALVSALSDAAPAPTALVAPWSAAARDVVPRVAARLGLGLTGDATGVEVEQGETPRVVWLKPAWAGTADALVISRTTPSIATLRPGAYAPLAPRDDVAGVTDVVDVEVAAPDGAAPRLVSSTDHGAGPGDDHADVLICLGADASADDAATAARVAEQLGAGLGGTPEAVRAGLVPERAELDIVRRSLSPRLCVAVGARSTEELTAVRGARVLVTIHEDERAPAHELASLAVATAPSAVLAGLTRE